MVLGNFMVLCEFDPDDVYRWFMELFIDAYDWVMVPNVYGMSQFADGGVMSTKPYISGSNYILKMSDHKKGDWCETWDALFWRFIAVHRDFFLSNPRLSMMARQVDKMDRGRLNRLLDRAENYLSGL
jgi:deoxyribodipyrimidine photolyase-related protein